MLTLNFFSRILLIYYHADIPNIKSSICHCLKTLLLILTYKCLRNQSICFKKQVLKKKHESNINFVFLACYSGDHDMIASYVGTQQWINSLNLTLDDDWRAWYTDGQVSG